MLELLTNTAATLQIAPLDDTDGLAVASALTLTAVYIQRGAESTVTATSPTLTHEGNGVHSLNIATASDLNFTDTALIRVVVADCLDTLIPVRVVSKLTNTAVNDVETDTQDLQTQIGTDGAGLTNVPWNASWDAEVESEVTDALNSYDPPTRSEATADKDAILTAVGTAQADLDILTGSDGVTLATSQPNYAPNTTTPPTAGAIADAVWDEATADHTTAGTFGKLLLDVLAKWAGINTLAGWLRLLARKDSTVATTHAAELAEINSIGGNYSNTADSLEANADAVAAVDNKVANTNITVISHQQVDGSVVLVSGDDYQVANGRSIVFTNADGTGWPASLSGTPTLTAVHESEIPTDGSLLDLDSVPDNKKITGTGGINQATAPNQQVYIELDAAATTDKILGIYHYDVETIISGDVSTLVTTERPGQTAPRFTTAANSQPKLELLRQFTKPAE